MTTPKQDRRGTAAQLVRDDDDGAAATGAPVYVEGQAPPRANALMRLCAAREQLWRAEGRQADAHGTPAESRTLLRVGEAAAEVAMREEWLHWIDRSTSRRPEADGDWGRAAEDLESGEQRSAESLTGTAAARRTRELRRGQRRPRPRSAT